MSITAYTGLPGHGKSYGVIENVIVPACKELRTVYTNIPVNKDEFLNQFGICPIHFEIKDIEENPNWFTEVFEAGSLFVVDECWRLWPAGLNSNKLPVAHKSFFAEHRHMVGDNGKSTEIILVTQDLAQIANFMRSLVETTFRVVKLGKLGASKSYRVDIYSGSVSGSNPPESKRDRQILGTFKKDIYRLYKSHTKSDFGAGDEKKSDGRHNILKGFNFKLIVISIVVLLCFVYYGSKNLFQFGPTPAPVQNKNTPVHVDEYGESNPQQVAIVREEKNILDSADNYYLSFNGGRYPNFEYIVRLEFGDNYSDLDVYEFTEMGFEAKALNRCLLKLSKGRKMYWVPCKGSEERKGLVESLASSQIPH